MKIVWLLAIRFRVGGKIMMKKEKSLESEDSRLWQRVKDSNPHIQSQSLLCYHYTNPLDFLFCFVLFTAATLIIIADFAGKSIGF